jgi:uncharacterized protein YecE (DUF72 family)
VLAGDSEHPWFSDVTASFVYVRLMGTRSGEPLGYSPLDLDRWADRACRWAQGSAPMDLLPLLTEPVSAERRDVFLYVINGFKVANPAAAQALMQRLPAARP